MNSRFQVFLFLIKYLFIPERSLNSGLDAPVSARIKDGFVFMTRIKTVLWIGISVFLTFLIAGLH